MLVRCVGHCRGAPSSHHARPDEMPRQERNDFSQRLPTNDQRASFDTTLRPTLKGPSLARTKFSKNDENLLLPVRNLCTRRLLGGREGNVPHSDCYLLSSDVPFDHNLDQTHKGGARYGAAQHYSGGPAFIVGFKSRGATIRCSPAA